MQGASRILPPSSQAAPGLEPFPRSAPALPVSRLPALVHHGKDADASRGLRADDAEGKPTTEDTPIWRLELLRHGGILANDNQHALDLLEELPPESGGASFIERGGLSELFQGGRVDGGRYHPKRARTEARASSTTT